MAIGISKKKRGCCGFPWAWAVWWAVTPGFAATGGRAGGDHILLSLRVEAEAARSRAATWLAAAVPDPACAPAGNRPADAVWPWLALFHSGAGSAAAARALVPDTPPCARADRAADRDLAAQCLVLRTQPAARDDPRLQEKLALLAPRFDQACALEVQTLARTRQLATPPAALLPYLHALAEALHGVPAAISNATPDRAALLRVLSALHAALEAEATLPFQPARREGTADGGGLPRFCLYGMEYLLWMYGGADRDDPRAAAALQRMLWHWQQHPREQAVTPSYFMGLRIVARALAWRGREEWPAPSGGNVRWRERLIEELLRRQQTDPATGAGYWRGDDPAHAEPLFCTAHALLALEVALGDETPTPPRGAGGGREG